MDLHATKESVCAVIVTYNIGAALYRCYDAICGQVHETVIVDNGSNKDTEAVLRRLQDSPRTKIMLNGSNLGIAAALNLGVKFARSQGHEWVVLLDHDSVAADDMVKRLLRACEVLQTCGIERVGPLGPVTVEAGKAARCAAPEAILAKRSFNRAVGRIIYAGGGLAIKGVDHIITSGSLLRTDLVDAMGYFDERLFIDGVDHEFCLRARQHGYAAAMVREAILFHRLGVATDCELLGRRVTVTEHSALRTYYMARNHIHILRLYWRPYPRIVARLIGGLLKDCVKLVAFQSQKGAKLGMMVKGIIHGLLGYFGRSQ